MYILPLCSHIIHQTHPHTLVVYLIWKVSHLSLWHLRAASGLYCHLPILSFHLPFSLLCFWWLMTLSLIIFWLNLLVWASEISCSQPFKHTFSSRALWCSNRDLRALRTSTSLETPAGDWACLFTTVILKLRSWRDTRHSRCSSNNWTIEWVNWEKDGERER